MKLLVTLILACTLPFMAQAQKFADIDKSPMDMAYYPSDAAFQVFGKTDEEKMARTKKMRVIYSRPMKKGREIWGNKDMAPYGEAYRLGANENTEIQFFVPVMLGDQVIPVGRYTLGAIPNKDKWTVFVNTDIDTWGVYAYDAGKNVAAIDVPVGKSEEVIEAFSMTFYKADSGMVHLKMGWGNALVEVPFKLVE